MRLEHPGLSPYEGAVTISAEGLAPVTVPLRLSVSAWTMSDPKDYRAVVEFIHTATLLHDDVVDSANMRRGLASANTLWGNEASVLVGDFLFSKSFSLIYLAPYRLR